MRRVSFFGGNFFLPKKSRLNEALFFFCLDAKEAKDQGCANFGDAGLGNEPNACGNGNALLLTSFALMQKKQKIKAARILAKKELHSAEMRKLASLRQCAFLNAAFRSFSLRQIR